MGKKIIVTSGPTNERIDSVMKITNMSTGALGCRIARELLNNHADEIDKLYYISTKLSYKPDYPFDDGKLELIEVESTQDLLNTLLVLLKDPTSHIDAVVHSAAVGDYKGKYTVRAEDLAEEILQAERDWGTLHYPMLMDIFNNPKAVQDDSGKMSSYEPHLMTMMELTPKVIGTIKANSPNTMLIGFKLLDGVSNDELFQVAAKLRRKNNADYIIANDLSRIGHGKHWAMVVAYDKISDQEYILRECETKDDIAATIRHLIFPTTSPIEINPVEAKIRQLIADNKHNLDDPSDTYAHGYEDALKDVLQAMGANVDSSRYD